MQDKRTLNDQPEHKHSYNNSKQTNGIELSDLSLSAAPTKRSFSLLNQLALRSGGYGVTQHYMSFLSWHDLSVLTRVSKQRPSPKSTSAAAQQMLQNFTEKSLLHGLLSFAQHPDILGEKVFYVETGFLWRKIRYESQFPDEKTITLALESDATPTIVKLNKLYNIIKIPLEYYLRAVLTVLKNNYERIHGSLLFPSRAIGFILRLKISPAMVDKKLLNLIEDVRIHIRQLYALIGHNDKLVPHFLCYGANPNDLLPYASSKEGIMALIRAGADVNKQDKEGNTVLMQEIRYCFLDSDRKKVQILVRDVKADVNISSPDESPLTLSAAKSDENYELIEILIMAGANVNARVGTHFKTALMVAANNHHANTVRLLLDAKAHINSADAHGKTILMYACSPHPRRNAYFPNYLENALKTIEMLILKGANIHAVDHQGRTALFYVKGGCRYKKAQREIADPCIPPCCDTTRDVQDSGNTKIVESALIALLNKHGLNELKQKGFTPKCAL